MPDQLLNLLKLFLLLLLYLFFLRVLRAVWAEVNPPKVVEAPAKPKREPRRPARRRQPQARHDLVLRARGARPSSRAARTRSARRSPSGGRPGAR